MSRLFTSLDEPEIVTLLQGGAVGVVPSDTQYGLICSALDEQAIERVYKLKRRDPGRQLILLAADLDQLLELDGLDRNTLLNAERFWPGAVSVVIPAQAAKLQAVHRGNKSIACRVPNYPALQKLLGVAGPLLAPSANPEGALPARNLAEAQAYFGNDVDFYVDGGELSGRQPSTVITFDEDGLVEILRQGAVQITEGTT